MLQFDLVSATVILKDPNKRQLEGNQIIDSQNIHEFVPDKAIVDKAQFFFQENEFSIGPFVGISFSIEADRKQFETFFGVDLNIDPQKGITIEQTGEYQLPISNMPESIQALIKQIIFSPPVEPFFNAI